MSDFDVKIEGLDQLERVLLELSEPAARRAMRKGMRVGANEVRNEARAKAPKASGRLRRRIRTRERSDEQGWMRFAIEVPTNAFWGLFQERGTSTQAAQPFLRPAASSKADVAVSKMRDALREAIEIEMRKARR